LVRPGDPHRFCGIHDKHSPIQLVFRIQWRPMANVLQMGHWPSVPATGKFLWIVGSRGVNLCAAGRRRCTPIDLTHLEYPETASWMAEVESQSPRVSIPYRVDRKNAVPAGCYVVVEAVLSKKSGDRHSRSAVWDSSDQEIHHSPFENHLYVCPQDAPGPLRPRSHSVAESPFA